MGCSRLLTWWSKKLTTELIWFNSLLRKCIPMQKRLVVQMVKNLPAMQETRFQSLGWEDPLQKGMATHSRILAWRIPWIEEPGGLQSVGLQRVRYNWATNTFIICIYITSYITSDMQMTPPYGRKWRGTKKPLDENERREWKSWLKSQHSGN